MDSLSDTPITDGIAITGKASMPYVAMREHAERMERDRALLLRAMREIAKPALGGKQQQYLAQAVLRELDSPR